TLPARDLPHGPTVLRPHARAPGGGARGRRSTDRGPARSFGSTAPRARAAHRSETCNATPRARAARRTGTRRWRSGGRSRSQAGELVRRQELAQGDRRNEDQRVGLVAVEHPAEERRDQCPPARGGQRLRCTLLSRGDGCHRSLLAACGHRRACCQTAASASRSSLPLAFFGTVSTTTTAAGTLKATSLARQCSSSDASRVLRPGRSATKPTGTSP